MLKFVGSLLGAFIIAAACVDSPAAQTAAQTKEEFVPQVGQPGKDVVWVPSPEETVAKMMEVGKITAQDFVVDLGSGDGRNVIAAAKLGARGLGVEYNPDMVALSKRIAAKEGVAERAQFVQGDMYEAEFSKATVLALFLLPENLLKLRPKFAELKPGTRIVANTFGIEGWTPEESSTISGDCTSWCTVLLYFVPAKVGGTWQTPAGTLTLNQEFQTITGTLGAATVESAKIKGDLISFTAGGVDYSGRVNGDTIVGTSKGRTEAPWRATRSR